MKVIRQGSFDDCETVRWDIIKLEKRILAREGSAQRMSIKYQVFKCKLTVKMSLGGG